MRSVAGMTNHNMVQQNHNIVQQCVWPPRACLHTLQHPGMLPMGRQMVSSQTLITASVRSPHSAENSRRIQKEPGLTAPTDGLSLGLRITDIQQKSRYPTWGGVFQQQSRYSMSRPCCVTSHGVAQVKQLKLPVGQHGTVLGCELHLRMCPCANLNRVCL